MKNRILAVVLMALTLVAARPVLAQESKPLGLAADLGLSSAYYFRGLNVFKKAEQADQHVLLAPSLTWTLPGLPLQVGYWGAFQLTGDNKSALVDGGLGAEQDLWVGYTHNLRSDLTLSAILTAYYYPLADEKVAGTSHPLYLEPGVGIAWAGPVDAALKVYYMYGVQDAVKLGRYVYVNPTLGKTLGLTGAVALAASLSAGYKLFNESALEDNRWDAGLTLALPVTLCSGWYVKPSISAVWTNLAGKALADEVGYAGAVNIGTSL